MKFNSSPVRTFTLQRSAVTKDAGRIATAERFARKAARAVLKKSPKTDMWTGHYATRGRLLTALLPNSPVVSDASMPIGDRQANEGLCECRKRAIECLACRRWVLA